MSKDRVHVTWDEKQGNWRVLREGNQRATSVHDTKEQAVKAGRDVAKDDKGQLLIHKKDGKIQEERTYRKDPYPPKG